MWMRALWIVMVVVARPAMADVTPPDVLVNVVPSKDGKTAPQLEVTVIGAPKVPLDQLAVSPKRDPSLVLPATVVRPYAQGTEPVAIALVVQGLEVWIGNDSFEKDEAARYPGALVALQKAIDKTKLAAAMPKGSTGMIVTYGRGAQVKLPMGELGKLTGAALGKQSDYRGTLTSDMAAGVGLALGELGKATAARKLMIVVGDGNDTNQDTAKASFTELRKKAQQQQVAIFQIVRATPISEPTAFSKVLTQNRITIGSVDDFGTALASIVKMIGDRYYVTFPTYDAKAKRGLVWDGKPFDLVVRIGTQQAEAYLGGTRWP